MMTTKLIGILLDLNFIRLLKKVACAIWIIRAKNLKVDLRFFDHTIGIGWRWLSNLVDRMGIKIFPDFLPAPVPNHDAVRLVGVSIDVEIGDQTP